MKYNRYASYKDSGVEWLGEIPVSWVVGKIKHYGIYKSGDFISSENIKNEGVYPVLGGNGLRGFSQAYNLKGNYVLIGRQGALCGNINYSKDKFWATEHAIVVHNNKNIDVKWLGEMLRTMNLNQYSVSAAQPGLAIENIINLNSAIPTLQEQQTIANYLDKATTKIDTLIAKQTKLIALLKEKRQAVISTAVTRGLDSTVAMKDSGVKWLGEIPEGWNRSKLGYETKVKARLGWKGLKAEEYVQDGYIFLATPNIKNNEIDYTNVNYITEERYKESPEIMLKNGDVLVTKDGSTTGTTNVVRLLPKPYSA